MNPFEKSYCEKTGNRAEAEQRLTLQVLGTSGELGFPQRPMTARRGEQKGARRRSSDSTPCTPHGRRGAATKGRGEHAEAKQQRDPRSGGCLGAGPTVQKLYRSAHFSEHCTTRITTNLNDLYWVSCKIVLLLCPVCTVSQICTAMCLFETVVFR